MLQLGFDRFDGRLVLEHAKPGQQPPAGRTRAGEFLTASPQALNEAAGALSLLMAVTDDDALATDSGALAEAVDDVLVGLLAASGDAVGRT